MYHKKEERELKRLKKTRSKEHSRELKGEKLCYKNGTEGKDEELVPGIVDLSTDVPRVQMPRQLANATESSPVEIMVSEFESFLSLEFQEQVNLIIIMEMGEGPIKYLKGRSGSMDDYVRSSYKESGVDIFVDGHYSGPTFRLLDLYHQAATRGTQTRRGRQIGKAVAKEILMNLPVVGMVAGYWDIGADGRFWPSLPGEVHVYAAHVTPGLHTLSFKFYDMNDKYLPRFDITRHYIPIHADIEQVLVIHSVENHDNAYMLSAAIN